MSDKFSAKFDRIENDFYRTFDPRAHKVLADVQEPVNYAEPCYGYGDLVFGLFDYEFRCSFKSDITNRGYEAILEKDALTLTAEDVKDCEYIITNPPWQRKILHQMIVHFSSLKPTWLLFEGDWAHTKQAIPYLDGLCTDIASVGRMKWIPGTNVAGKKDIAWYRFSTDKKDYIKFHQRKV
jgi:hypothetical protein